MRPLRRRAGAMLLLLLAGGLLVAGCERGSGGTASRAGGPDASEASGAAPVGEARSGAQARRRASQRLGAELVRASRGDGTPIALVEEATALRNRPGVGTLARLGTETEFGSPRVLAVVGRDGDWLEVMSAELDNGQTGFVRAADMDVGGTDYSLRASLTERTLEVRRDGRLVRSVAVAIGGPATPTPTGTFAVTDKLEMSDPSSIYGCCVLAFTGHQPNVPQGWAGGDRLAVHATPHEATIGHAASLGCLRATEHDMRWLLDRVPLGTLVEIVP